MSSEDYENYELEHVIRLPHAGLCGVSSNKSKNKMPTTNSQMFYCF